jgi:hypothetical protein
LQSPRKLVKVNDAKTSLLLWSTHIIPIDLALAARHCIRSCPKERSLELDDSLQSSGKDNEQRDVKNILGGDDGFDKCASTGIRNVLSMPRDKLGARFVDEGLHINHL